MEAVVHQTLGDVIHIDPRIPLERAQVKDAFMGHPPGAAAVSEEDESSVYEAMTKTFVDKRLKHSTCLKGDYTVTPGASNSNTTPADEQGEAPAGVTRVSIESDSDQALSPSEEGSEARLAEESIGFYPNPADQAEEPSQG